MSASREPLDGSRSFGKTRSSVSPFPMERGRTRPATALLNVAKSEENGISTEKTEKSPFSYANGRGRVDTTLAHPYIFLFDPDSDARGLKWLPEAVAAGPSNNVHLEGLHRFLRLPGAQSPLEEVGMER